MEMGDRTLSALGDGLSLEQSLPVRWLLLEKPPVSEELAEAEGHNVELLRVVSGLDEYAPDLSDQEPAVAHELQRLDFKLNVLLRLVGQVYIRLSPIPPDVTVRLSSEAFEWDCLETLPKDGILRFEIYLNRRYPLPLIAFGHIDAIATIPNGYRIRTRFLDMGGSVREGLEKIIFQHHRRHVANSRRK
jgi:hypothetical protein